MLCLSPTPQHPSGEASAGAHSHRLPERARGRWGKITSSEVGGQSRRQKPVRPDWLLLLFGVTAKASLQRLDLTHLECAPSRDSQRRCFFKEAFPGKQLRQIRSFLTRKMLSGHIMLSLIPGKIRETFQNGRTRTARGFLVVAWYTLVRCCGGNYCTRL